MSPTSWISKSVGEEDIRRGYTETKWQGVMCKTQRTVTEAKRAILLKGDHQKAAPGRWSGGRDEAPPPRDKTVGRTHRLRSGWVSVHRRLPTPLLDRSPEQKPGQEQDLGMEEAGHGR